MRPLQPDPGGTGSSAVDYELLQRMNDKGVSQVFRTFSFTRMWGFGCQQHLCAVGLNLLQEII